MNRTLRKIFLAVCALCLVPMFGAVACAKEPKAPDPVTYTVTVTWAAEDESAAHDVLSSVRVQLLKENGSAATEKKALELDEASGLMGSVSFELEPATYMVDLTGSLEGYEVESATLTATSRNATLMIADDGSGIEPPSTNVDYDVTVTYPDGRPVGADVTVQLCVAPGQAGAGTCNPTTTDKSGTAHFSLPSFIYELHIICPDGYAFDDYAYRLGKDGGTLTVALQEAVEYEISVVYEDGTPVENVSVQMIRTLDAGTEENVAHAPTEADGTVRFALLGVEYGIRLDEQSTRYFYPEGYTYEPATVSAESPRATVTLHAPAAHGEDGNEDVEPAGDPGSEGNPLPFAMAANTVNIPADKAAEGVWYVFTPETTANYCIATMGKGAEVSMAFSDQTIAGIGRVTLRLEAGRRYLFCCKASGGTSTYLVMISLMPEMSD